MANRLFPIPLCGGGSAEVESLPSYIHRLAYKHAASVGELLRFAVRQVERDDTYTGQVPVLPSYIHVHEILRHNKLAVGLIEMLEHMTLQGLQGTTVSLFNGPLTMSRGELKKAFRWCPECLGEMTMMGEEPYFKLVWQFRAVRACPIHRSPFLERCEFCHCDQTSYVKQRPLSYCQECGKPLFERRRKLTARDFTTRWQDIGRDILELLADLGRYSHSSLPADGVFRSLDQLLDHYWRQDRDEEFYRLLDRDQLLSVIHNRSTLCLNAARRVAFGLGISLYDLISGNAAQTTETLNLKGFCPLPPSFMDASERLTRNHKAILLKLHALMNDHPEPLSLKATAKRLGVSVGYLEYRFPVQVHHIVDRYRTFITERQQQKRRLAQERALQYFTDRSAETPKSRKQAYRVIREETGLPKFMLKEAIKQVYQALN